MFVYSGDEGDALRPPKRVADDADELEVPDAKRSRDSPPEVLSFQHPVSELMQKYSGAIFNFKSTCVEGEEGGREGERDTLCWLLDHCQ